jgi:hypothetical protein
VKAGSARAADSAAEGAAVGSPGVLSGNLVQVPVHVPVDVCGNTVNVIALLNPALPGAQRSPGVFVGYSETGIERSSAVRMIRDCSATWAAG